MTENQPVIVVHLDGGGHLTACTGAPMPPEPGEQYEGFPRVLCTGCAMTPRIKDERADAARVRRQRDGAHLALCAVLARTGPMRLYDEQLRYKHVLLVRREPEAAVYTLEVLPERALNADPADLALRDVDPGEYPDPIPERTVQQIYEEAERAPATRVIDGEVRFDSVSLVAGEGLPHTGIIAVDGEPHDG